MNQMKPIQPRNILQKRAIKILTSEGALLRSLQPWQLKAILRATVRAYRNGQRQMRHAEKV